MMAATAATRVMVESVYRMDETGFVDAKARIGVQMDAHFHTISIRAN
jgi:hypothetical protein